MVEDDKIFEMFAESCLEQLRGIETAILDLESAGPEALGPKVAAVFRAAHTIKGDAGAVGAAPLAELAHATESVLDAVRQGHLAVSPKLISELLAVFDGIKVMVQDPVAARSRDVAPETARMAALLAQEQAPPAPRPETATAEPAAEETSSGETRSDERIRKLAIDARELDVLVDRVGELGIAQARLAALSTRDRDGELRDVAEEVARLAGLLRDQVLGLRLLPIKISFPKYRRLVRDTCAALGKDAELVMDGENTELDKGVIEQLNTPCIHLLRNAVDHGIEPPATRQALGKSPRGVIRLCAHQDGNDVVIAISDDGAGIDAAKLWQKAVAAGRIAPDRPFDAQAAQELIFLPGLSTAEQVGAVSGRGVGMDAVREGIDALRGRIEVSSTPGAGSVFTIRLPVSLAIIDCLEVRLGGETYYLHLDYVEECLELPPSVILRQGRGMMDLRGQAMPLVSLRRFFGMPGLLPATSHVVTVRRDEKRAGFVVDEVVGRKQAVLKHLGRALGKVAGVLGATVTEAGDMALVVDVPGLLAAALAEAAGPSDNTAAPGASGSGQTAV